MRPLYLLSFLLLHAIVFAQKSKTERLDSLFSALHASGSFNGNVLIAENGTPLFERSYGFANFATGEKLDAGSVFELASVSKQFTATAIMLLKEEGKLRYEDEIGRWLPGLAHYKGVTIRHLLQHTGGLPEYEGLLDSLWTDKRRIVTNEDLVAFYAQHRFAPVFTPGERWAYSNTGYAFLGSIIEKASGTSYGSYLDRKIFRPLGMKNTTVYRRRFEKGRILPHYAYGYMRDGAKGYVLPDSLPRVSFVHYLDGIVGDGTVNASARDLLIWDVALRSGKLLSPAALAEAYAPAVLADGKTHPYGFGWAISKSPAGRSVSHSGGWPGYHTFIGRDLDSNKTIILLKNVEGGGLPVAQVNRILYHLPEPVRKASLQLPEAVLETYVGVYQLAQQFSITITRAGAQLYGQGTGQGKFMLHAEKEDLFSVQGVDARVGFVKKEGKVDHLVLYQGGQEQVGKKIH